MRSAKLLTYTCLGFASALLVPTAGSAAPLLRKQVDQHGDFVMFGNTLGWDCSISPTGRVLTGSVSGCNGTGTADTGIDVYWESDFPGTGQAQASTNITMANARSTAMLVLPAGARVSYARLYWAAFMQSGGTPDSDVTIERPGVYTQAVHSNPAPWTAIINAGETDFWYQGSADITDFVSTAGPGPFRLSGVSSVSSSTLTTLNNHYTMAGWAVVVFYERASDPPRNLALFDGLDPVNTTTPQSAQLTGFLVPQAGYKAKLGVLAYEGDSGTTTDQLEFNANVLTNALNPANDFFNSTHSDLNDAGASVGVSNTGDLPKLSGTEGSMGGVDMDVVDITSYVQKGDTTANIKASTGTGAADRFVIGALITSISTFKPDFSSSGKTVRDVNGGAVRPGDVLEYTVTVTNTGNDTSTETLMTDELPAQVTYVPNSIKLLTPTDLNISDTPNNDVGEYDAATRSVRVRLGTGATATTGGEMAPASVITLRFQVTLNGNASGVINNQAIISSEGKLGAPPGDFPTDANGSESGVPPTGIVVDQCSTDADCTAPTSHCDTSLTPAACVVCATSAQCTNPLIPDCNPASHICECTGGNCQDTDQDGMSDRLEISIGTNPNDADSDDDGVTDNAEVAPSTDSDNDGLINALDPDSDNDGLFDGTELGLACSGAGTDLTVHRCVPDADGGATKTDPLAADTDGGGVRDGSEDANLNGRVDTGESDPTLGHGADDLAVVDSDADGLSNLLETFLHSNPNDRDSDDDGVPDGSEPNPSDDVDGDGLIDLLDADSDNDGLFDGTELGLDCTNPDTDSTVKACRGDADAGQSRTSPLLRDTDHGGVMDGSEDANLDGRVDTGETNPITGHGTDDNTVVDTDGDGLSDLLEATLGSSHTDADSDDDGVRDGAEANPSADTDGDGVINVLDKDSDGDGLFDGTELGQPCLVANGTATNNPPTCIADADAGLTTTSPLLRDTDRGGILDGTEDVNHNGSVDNGERDPNLASDDQDCFSDAQCDASVTSGRVCNASHICINGCRGSDGNGCPTGQTCSSTTSAIGTCAVVTGAAGAAGASGNDNGGNAGAGNGGANPGNGGAESIGGGVGTSGASGEGGVPNGTTGSNLGMGGLAQTGGTLGAAGNAQANGGTINNSSAVNLGGSVAAAGTASGGITGTGVVSGGTSSGASAGRASVGGSGTDTNVAVAGTTAADTGASGGNGNSGTTVGESGGSETTLEPSATGGSEAVATSNTMPGAPRVGEGERIEGGGCDCATHNATGSSKLWLLMLTFGLIRRRRNGSSNRSVR
ncbi:MAG TPA: isopeptide-forming domain-containing fimbrial protein [Polyangiaceae bacterium]